VHLLQGERKLKDFDIENAAHGVDRVVKQPFKAVVKDRTLEIRLQYAGKGSTAVPKRGTYGPLISAISIESGNLVSHGKIAYTFKKPIHLCKCKTKITGHTYDWECFSFIT
jgi:hypothetical protein